MVWGACLLTMAAYVYQFALVGPIMLIQRAIKLYQTVDQRPEEGCWVEACVHGLAWRRRAGGVTYFPTRSLQTPHHTKGSAEGRGMAPHTRAGGMNQLKGGGVQRRRGNALMMARTKNITKSRAPHDEEGRTLGTARPRNSSHG